MCLLLVTTPKLLFTYVDNQAWKYRTAMPCAVIDCEEKQLSLHLASGRK
jgi:hypothetical protein